MFELRRNIVFSLLIHAMLIAYAIAVTSRGVSYHVPVNYMTVSLQSEVEGTQFIKSHDASPSPLLNSLLNLALDNSQGTTIVYVNQDEPREIVTGQNKDEMQSADKVNPTSSPDKSPQPSLTKVGMGEFSDEISQNSGSDFGESNSNSIYTSIRDAIERAKIYPLLARKKKIEGTVIAEFLINNKGFPESIKIRKSSGSEILNAAALDIIKRAAPLPYIEGHIVIPITFSLTNTISSH